MTPPSRPRPVHGPVFKTCVICDKEPRQHTTKELDTCLSRVFAEVLSQGLDASGESAKAPDGSLPSVLGGSPKSSSKDGSR